VLAAKALHPGRSGSNGEVSLILFCGLASRAILQDQRTSVMEGAGSEVELPLLAESCRSVECRRSTQRGSWQPSAIEQFIEYRHGASHASVATGRAGGARSRPEKRTMTTLLNRRLTRGEHLTERAPSGAAGNYSRRWRRAGSGPTTSMSTT
jgi:hypothetical protein